MQGLGAKDGAKYATVLTVTGLMAGAVVEQMKAMIAGQDPRDMTDPRFWVTAWMKSGAMGVYSDAVFNSERSYGGGLTTYLAGPTLSELGKTLETVTRPIRRPYEGKEVDIENMAGDLAKQAMGYVPGTKLFYTRLAYDRMVTNELQELMSPGYARRMERRVRSKTGQRYWWRPNKNLPDRAPDIPAAVGE